MSKGFRVLLQIFQVLCLLAALLFMAVTFLMTYLDFGGTDYEEAFVGTWVVGFGVLSIAFSPALWSLNRGRGNGAAPAPMAGTYDRVVEQPPAQPQPPRPGSAFEPIGNDRAPAPPASSYGQPSGPNFGAQPSGGGITPTSSPQGDTPWGGSR
ncbi:hypothetical protein [Glycomyces arizonensis]|uniref:hypothetical protein n=1 Tax=Glycomyces arizonensis TaxID=256035 RepID=UPI0012EBF81B|nr:hypothetical protein [Glycomyces arizonensis]